MILPGVTERHDATTSDLTVLSGGIELRSIMRERDVLNQILDYLAAKHVFAGRIGTGRFFGEHQGKRWAFRSHTFGAGCADILAFPGPPGEARVLWIECKAPGGVQSPVQKSFETEVKLRGHEYIVARSIDDLVGLI